MLKFKSKPVPVKAKYDEYKNMWIVYFPDGEVHEVKAEYFKLRFEPVKTFSNEDHEYAKRLAQIGDCE